jgi:hypothetical protein
MIRVEGVETAASYYGDVFGLHPTWSGDGSIDLVFPETDAEMCSTATRIFPHRLRFITWSMTCWWKCLP